MKKILLVGKLNNTVKELYEGLSRRFQVQVCVEQWRVVEGMMSIIDPDMVLVNIMDLEDIEENVFRMLEQSYKHLPILVLGTEEGCNKYDRYLHREKLTILKRPISKQVLMQVCYQLVETEGAVEEVLTEEPVEAPKRLLIVDDSPVTLRSIKVMLDKNYQISVATSGEQALKSLQKAKPDLVLLDYEMPGLNGKETLEKIRENEETANIPVIFLTGVADKEHIAAVLTLNPAGYFLKPAEKDKLIAAIEEVFNK